MNIRDETLGRRPVDKAYLGFGESAVLTGRFHRIKWLMPAGFAAALFVFAAISTVAPRLAVVTIVSAAVWAKLWGPLRRVPLLLFLAITFGLALFAEGVMTLAVIAAAVWAAWQWLEYRLTTFTLTTFRIVRRSGVFTTQTATMSLRALTDLRLEETIPGQLLRYGHFKVESAGQEQAFTDLRFVPYPDFFYRLVMTVALGKEPPSELLDPRMLPRGWAFA